MRNSSLAESGADVNLDTKELTNQIFQELRGKYGQICALINAEGASFRTLSEESKQKLIDLLSGSVMAGSNHNFPAADVGQIAKEQASKAFEFFCMCEADSDTSSSGHMISTDGDPMQLARISKRGMPQPSKAKKKKRRAVRCTADSVD